MSIIVWFMLIGSCLAHGHTLATQHHSTEPHLKTSVSLQEYRVEVMKASNPKKTCEGTTIALSTRNKVMRLRRDGKEQLLDWSWSFDWDLPTNGVTEHTYEFIGPVSHQIEACRLAKIYCDQRERLHSTVTLCDPPERKDIQDTGKPHLVLHYVNFVNPRYNPWTYMEGGVHLGVEIKGVITEKWRCPEVEVRWPDGTRSVSLSDCGPEDDPVRHWSFRHPLGCGENSVWVFLFNQGQQVAAKEARIRVIC